MEIFVNIIYLYESRIDDNGVPKYITVNIHREHGKGYGYFLLGIVLKTCSYIEKVQ